MGSSLPEAFVTKMERLLGTEFPAFLASYEDTRWYGLRVNTLKCSVPEFQGMTSLKLDPIPWASTGYYYREEDRPGKHPYYHAGLYYIQEPSAMAPVELLDVRPGERVLDLCAAPGGKSTQIAAKLAGEGVLVTNDIHPDRVKALVKNIELSGARNAVILNERPERLEEAFQGFFDKILIDAPCSGEGMFRKEEEMAKSWQPAWVDRYAGMQRDLLKQGAAMLRPGGRLVYSTCTFSPEENELMIAEFLGAHPEFQVVPVLMRHGFQPGNPSWVDITEVSSMQAAAAAQQLQGAARLWPHQLSGEGHFVAVLEHRIGRAAPSKQSVFPSLMTAASGGKDKAKSRSKERYGWERGLTRRQPVLDLQPFYEFMRQMAPGVPVDSISLHGEHIYVTPQGLPDLSGIRVIRPGWYMGSLKKQRFEPAHALAMGLRLQETSRFISLSSDDPAVVRYLKGETLEMPEERVQLANGMEKKKGYCLVGVDGYPIGWGKWLDGMLKNDYPPGWRWT
ncbi:RsmB/NOP family class I SAM-dependent RNA methyltransferase [Paenibacillus doosanensis]|uniref:Ribosomal RNA small subunit methyltransferase F n=1 Tax=Paenibacillus konkukensis TaxID=2020716 RepID=A0ABY4RJY5_9BACL|nr:MULTISPECIES: RsmB/NOP family class I SAM-dependent RNA methyltransferase [Paenibacillus]MCS7460123.1 RsmB/NOP family class I SAM-dependent RNA methyltransferase [Paenibacillus doosanensis]UQZ82779.1 Ribosomal RNA small subunit methyltransferase F [Paenibacillus konkukensis]